MKVLDLQCTHQHGFEGWFASEDDFQSQLARALVACPLCGDTAISKKLSAPRLNLSTARGERDAHNPAAPETPTPAEPGNTALPETSPSNEVSNVAPAQLQAAWLQAMRHVMANTEDVGHHFCEEARKMHYGEADQRNIRGHATPEETEALRDEGIQVMPLPIPEALKEPLQ